MRNMGNYKSLITAFLLLLVSSHLYAEGEIPGEGYSQNKEIRNNRAVVSQALNDSTYQNRINSTYNASNKDIVARYESSYTNTDGAKTNLSATVTKPSNAAKVASTLAKRLEKAKALGKASLPSFLGSAALTALVNGIGWVMDEGGKVTKASTSCSSNGSTCPAFEYYFTDYTNYYSDLSAACNGIYSKTTQFTTQNSDCKLVGNQILLYKKNTDATYGQFGYRYKNSYYSSTATQPATEVNTDELATKIAEQINNPTYTTAEENNKKLIAAAYGLDPTFSLSDDTVNGLAIKIGDQVAAALQAAAEVQTGTATTTDSSDSATGTATVQPASTTATGTTTGTGTSTTNPDGSTTTETQTSSQFQMPAFCDWASIMCDWYKYTQEKYEEVKTAITDFVKAPDATDTALDIDTETDTQDAPILNFGGQCPASIQLASGQIAGIDIDWQFDFTDFCTVLSTYVRPILIAMGAFIAILILGGVRTTDD